MNTITISESNAFAALDEAPENLKPVLKTLLGLSTTPQTWEDIKTFEDVFKVKFKSGTNILPIEVTENEQLILSYNGQEKNMLAVVAFLKISLISRAMNCLENGGQLWQPDWSNSGEYKYYPWLKYVAGSGFSDVVYVCGLTSTGVGSRLCFKRSEMARHAAVHFKDLYNDLFTL